MSKTTMEFDLREFKAAVKKYQQATKKSVPEILNHAATQAAFRATQARYTPQARKNWPLNKPPTLKPGDGKRRRGKRGFGKGGHKTQKQYRDSLWFALGQMSKHAGDGALAAATKVYNSRVRSVAFIRANWGAVTGKLGIKRSTKFVKNPDIQVRKATLARSVVDFYNAKLDGKGAGQAYSKLSPGFRNALHDAVWGKNGMVDYAERKLKKLWKR